MPSQKILIVEDETSLVEILTYNLQREGYDVLSASDGQQGLQRARSHLPDLIVLDLMLPVLEGLEVCRALRADPSTRDLPILMLTAKAEEVDEIVGFHLGADDYVTKPFKIKPLLQRIKALLRRRRPDDPSGEQVHFRELEMDKFRHLAKLAGETLELTPTEFNLLWTLVRQPGRAFSRHDLLETCIGRDADSVERTIDVHIRSLRWKLGQHAGWIETVRGIGYRCCDDSEKESPDE